MKELIYDYLLNNCVGYDNRIKGWQLMNLFNIKDLNEEIKVNFYEVKKC